MSVHATTDCSLGPWSRLVRRDSLPEHSVFLVSSLTSLTATPVTFCSRMKVISAMQSSFSLIMRYVCYVGLQSRAIRWWLQNPNSGLQGPTALGTYTFFNWLQTQVYAGLKLKFDGVGDREWAYFGQCSMANSPTATDRQTTLPNARITIPTQ